uniref:Uncharacterized protein n=1 Tax=Tanacetum cinerariifolium TaxID=118510 RepID=A0A6L2J2A2_TANCI|nr:hypothetical protein [Tanacetum cinerariifolium]
MKITVTYNSPELRSRKGNVEGDLVARANQARHDVDLVDDDDVDLFNALDLENRVTKLEDDFTRLLKAKKAKEAKKAEEAELQVKVLAEVVQVSKMKETPTTSKGPRRQLASTSTRSRAPIASTTSRILDVYLPCLLLMLHHVFPYKRFLILYSILSLAMMLMFRHMLVYSSSWHL